MPSSLYPSFRHDPCGVQGVFRTYEELTDYLKEYEGYYEDPPLGYRGRAVRICSLISGERTQSYTSGLV